MCHSVRLSDMEDIMKLKEIRMSRHLKMQDVADYLCCLPSVYSRYESGKREPSLDVLLKLSKLYHVSVDYLIGNDEVADKYHQRGSIGDSGNAGGRRKSLP